MNSTKTKPKTLRIIEEVVSEQLNEDIETIRSRTVSEHRKVIEKRHGGAPMKIVSHFPDIGRGNVLGDRTIDHSTVESMFIKALKG